MRSIWCARRFALLAIHLRRSRARQPPAGAVHDRRRHLQIAQEFGGRRAVAFGSACRCALKTARARREGVAGSR